MENNNKKIWLWVIIALLVIGIIYLIASSRDTTDTVVTVDETGETSVRVADQTPDSLSVVVDFVSLAKPGFVVIHKNANGQPGEIIGVSELLEAGESRSVSILANLTAGESYFAMLHADNGNGQFSAELDAAFVDEKGDPIMGRFEVMGEVEGASKG